MKALKILFADDDLKYSMLLKRFLEKEGYEVTYAGNGKIALEQFPLIKPDLVLLDINMPGYNGFEVAERIREMDKHVLIFFLSDRSDKADRLQGFQLKANDYLAKPFYPEELTARIRERFTSQLSGVAEDEMYAFGHSVFNYSTNEIRTGNSKVLSENIFIFGLLYKQDTSKKRELMMSLGGWMNKVLIGWGIDPKFADMFDETIIALLMVGLSIGLDYLCQAIFVGGMKHYTRRSPHQWNTLLMKRRVIHHLIHILPGILIYYLLPMAFVRGKDMLEFSQKVCAVYIIVAVLLTINGLLLVMLDVYNMKDKQKNRPLKGFVQVLQVLLFFIGGRATGKQEYLSGYDYLEVLHSGNAG